MALINDTIGIDLFQKCRDSIASILLLELPNQATLQTNVDLNFSLIWQERKRPFNASEIPAINLSIDAVNYGAKHRGQREANPIYTIDVYDAKVSTADEDADKLVSDNSWQIARTIQYILDHPIYSTLNLKPDVYHTEVVSIEAGQAEMTNDNRCSVLRIKFQVKTISVLNGATPTTLSQSNTSVKLESTDKGHFYQLITT